MMDFKQIGKMCVFFFVLTASLSYSEESSSNARSLADKTYRLSELDQQIDSLKKWQGQYQKKAKSFQLKASRVQFKSTTDTKRYRNLSQEAQSNVDSLEEQITFLISQKEDLLK